MKSWLLLLLPVLGWGQFHRAEQDREIRYWLLDPATHAFRISHDFTVSLVGQKSVHSFVRAGSAVSPDSKMFDLDTVSYTHLVGPDTYPECKDCRNGEPSLLDQHTGSKPAILKETVECHASSVKAGTGSRVK